MTVLGARSSGNVDASDSSADRNMGAWELSVASSRPSRIVWNVVRAGRERNATYSVSEGN